MASSTRSARDLAGGHHDLGTAGGHLVGHMLVLQHVDHLARLARVEIGVEQGHAVGGGAEHQQRQQREQGGGDRAHCGEPPGAQSLQPVQQAFHRTTPKAPSGVAKEAIAIDDPAWWPGLSPGVATLAPPGYGRVNRPAFSAQALSRGGFTRPVYITLSCH